MASRTNPIGTGTAQLTANAPSDFVRVLGKAACNLNQSRSRLALALMILGADAVDPAMANQLREICKRYYGYAVETIQAVAQDAKVTATAAFLAIFTAGMFAALISHSDDSTRACRRCARRPGLRFEECVTIETEEI